MCIANLPAFAPSPPREPGASSTALPLLLVFFVFQRRIITAVTLTGLKGT